MMMDDDLLSIQQRIQYNFQQVKLLRAALTHSSWANEAEGTPEDNERLEFLGDAVLDLVVSEEAYRRFPGAPEGNLTRLRSNLVKEKTLAILARELELDFALRLGRGEEAQGGRKRSSLLADALEAVFGAVFLDGGYAAATRVVARVLAGRWPERLDLSGAKDPKSRLQERTQRRFGGRPVYVLRRSSGPEHEKIFEVQVTLPDGRTVEASGASLKKAEQTAAALALERLDAEVQPPAAG